MLNRRGPIPPNNLPEGDARGPGAPTSTPLEAPKTDGKPAKKPRRPYGTGPLSMPRAWTIEEVSLMFDYSIGAVSGMLRDGRLRGYKERVGQSVRINGHWMRPLRWRISSAALEEYVQRLEAATRETLAPPDRTRMFSVLRGTPRERRARATRAAETRWSRASARAAQENA